MDRPLVIIDTQHAFGYHCPEDFDHLAGQGKLLSTVQNFRQIIYFHDICNVLSIVLSPIVGLIRAVGAVYALYNFSQMDQRRNKMDLSAAKRFFWMELGRAGLELLCLGPLLATVVDGIMTLKHKKMFCFAEQGVNT